MWGLRPIELHDRFWAARGVQVVRHGQRWEIARGAELYLLTSAHSLVIFNPREAVDLLTWLKLKLLYVRIRDTREKRYSELALTDERSRFQRFKRLYNGMDLRTARIALTPCADLAERWQAAPDPRSGWYLLRDQTRPVERSAISSAGRIHDALSVDERMEWVHSVIASWQHPDTMVPRVKRVSGLVWAHEEARIDRKVTFVGPVWIGAGRQLTTETVAGPAVLWDDPAAHPATDPVRWGEAAPKRPRTRPLSGGHGKPGSPVGKRLFDVVFALCALVLGLPFYPFVMIAILCEDGWPCFFAHRRETVGGRVFPCLKFRTMRRDAEKLKSQLRKKNQVDGPQFYMEKDPRLTRIGHHLRAFKIDEHPQFFNVLLGHMSVVGPRPSPFEENQFCPSWREARLSVRPGITGLWQVMRTRRPGSDFQEWIKYDVEYVEKQSWRLDLWIIWKTIGRVLNAN